MKYLKKYKSFESIDYNNLSNSIPDTLEEQISFSLKWYTSLYDKKYGRMKVLEHMYLSYGTGCEWINGKLLDTYRQSEVDEYRRRLYQWEEKKKEIQKDLDREMKFWNELHEIEERTGVNTGGSLSSIQKRIDDLQNQMDDFGYYDNRYPCEEKPLQWSTMENYSKSYSPIFHIPDDITEEYLNGAKELINYILSFKDKKNTKLYKDIQEVNKMIETKFGK